MRKANGIEMVVIALVCLFAGAKPSRGEALTERERVLQRPRGKDLELSVETRRSRAALGPTEWSL